MYTNSTHETNDFDTRDSSYDMIHMNAAIYPHPTKLLMLAYQISLFGFFFFPLLRSERFLWRCSSQLHFNCANL